MVLEEVRRSKLTFENIDYHLAAVYLGSTMSVEKQCKEAIRKLIQQRRVRTRRGRKPTVHSKELGVPRGRKSAIMEEEDMSRMEEIVNRIR